MATAGAGATDATESTCALRAMLDEFRHARVLLALELERSPHERVTGRPAADSGASSRRGASCNRGLQPSILHAIRRCDRQQVLTAIIFAAGLWERDTRAHTTRAAVGCGVSEGAHPLPTCPFGGFSSAAAVYDATAADESRQPITACCQDCHHTRGDDQGRRASRSAACWCGGRRPLTRQE